MARRKSRHARCCTARRSRMSKRSGDSTKSLMSQRKFMIRSALYRRRVRQGCRDESRAKLAGIRPDGAIECSHEWSAAELVDDGDKRIAAPAGAEAGTDAGG